MAIGDIKFNKSTDTTFVVGSGNFATSVKIDAEEASLGKLTIGVSASGGAPEEPCKFCTKDQSAIVFTVGAEKHGFCARCIVMILTMMNATVAKTPQENQIRVPCDGCGYKIQPSHGTQFQGRDATKFLCDRCFDGLVDILEARPQPVRNILT